jgi:hypothetical protein
MRGKVWGGWGLLLLGLTACGSRPKAAGTVAGALSGHVFVTGPVRGAIVSAYHYDPRTGRRLSEIAQSDPTTEDGSYEVALGIEDGPVLLVARGAGASYVEPATGATVTFDVAAELSSVYAQWTSAMDLDFAFPSGDRALDLEINPFTDLAVTYGQARLALGRDGTLGDGLRRSYLLFAEHLELDFWWVPPVDLTAAGPRSWNAAAQADALFAGLSMLVRRMGEESGTGGFSSLALLELLERDLSNGVSMAGAWTGRPWRSAPAPRNASSRA